MKLPILTLALCCFLVSSFSQSSSKGNLADKPLFRDPVFDGAADPVVIWNAKEKKWFMLYTNRRANAQNAPGVTWVHGTRIGIAESVDGAHWTYRDTANINYRPTAEYTHWAPEVVENGGIFHMFLTYVPGIFADWNHPREILHLMSSDLLNWNYRSTLRLASDRVIDACVLKLPNGKWRMWYNNEKDSKSIYFADSDDLDNWSDKGKAYNGERGEGPKVFEWKRKYWMLVDNWKGMSFQYSDDLINWTTQPGYILGEPGIGREDQAIGGHADVVVNNNRAYVFYFTHPGRAKGRAAVADPAETKRSLIQVVELRYNADGTISADRNKAVYIKLKRP